ncbi:phosphoglycerate kinase [Candidatus Woesebacteria bacterium]|nr:phosphoglycerate kinase [Candidatus Woesebacteria bacterium]
MAITYIDGVEIKNKRVLLRVDFNVSLNADHTIANDERIRQTLPTIMLLLKNNNTLIFVSHLGQPKGYDATLTTERIATRLQELTGEPVLFVPHEKTFNNAVYESQPASHKMFMLDNVRFFKGEQTNEPDFTKQLASLAEIYVTDAFGVCHRPDASVVGVPALLPHYGGLLLKREVSMISKITQNPQKPVVAILGGAKISTKISLIGKLMEIADYLLIGGGLANTFLCAMDMHIGQSMCEIDEVQTARRLLFDAAAKQTAVIVPKDAVVGTTSDSKESIVKKVATIADTESILDIGPETQAEFGNYIAKAKTIVWNGPLGYIENPEYKRGTDFVYYAITQNREATSVVGGGDTISAISKEEYLDHITHISTGGGAMLEFIEKGTLPGIDALGKES